MAQIERIKDDEDEFYIIASYYGPFGATTQTSSRMRVSEAACACDALAAKWREASFEIVPLRSEHR